MSLNKLIEDMIEELSLKEEDLEEISVTHAGMAYDTPKAFKKKDDEEDIEEAWGDNAEVYGYKKVKNVRESIFKRMASQSFLKEASYKDYKRDESMSSKKKVNQAIKEINSKLFVIERIINQNVKLKTEDGVDSTKYWKSTRGNLYKISEKMIRISEKLRKF
tara:strand:- start:177 stop:662 length:486 start_codon:yes stop_codon:yes gene_type:complete